MLQDLSPEVTDHLLHSQFFGRIACADNGQVLVLPVTYLFDGKAIYGQTYEGTKTRLLRKNPLVCFEVDEACSPTYWRSVVVQGVFEELTGDERNYVVQRLGPGRLPPRKDGPMNPDEITPPRPIVTYRIRILSKLGRSETKDN